MKTYMLAAATALSLSLALPAFAATMPGPHAQRLAESGDAGYQYQKAESGDRGYRYEKAESGDRGYRYQG